MKITPITSFRGEFAFLSNFYTSEIRSDGIVYPTAEHFFQAHKTTDKDERAKIAAALTPSQAKAMGRKVALRDDWDRTSLAVMYVALERKFAIPELRQRLLMTYPRMLVEGNTWGDTKWGVCNGNGDNLLGVLLMERRTIIGYDKE